MIDLQARGPQLPDLSRQTAQYANMMNMARQQEAAQLQGERARQEMDFARAGEAREAELQAPRMAKAQSEAALADLKTGVEFNAYVYMALKNANSPEQVAGFARRIADAPQFQSPLYQGTLSDAVASMPADPAQFDVWRKQTGIKALTAAQQMEQEYIKQTTGTEERLISVPKFGNAGATEVPGSRIQVAPGMTYVKGADDATYAMPTKGVGSFGTPAPAAAGDTFKIMIGMESGGNQFAKSGAPLTSPKGAIGIAQIMPGTAPEAAKLAGLPYDKARLSNDRDYNLALGEAYFNKQLADFGDPRLAAAAYNAGPGAVRRALAKGGPDGWINHVPRETQNYVASIPGGGGQANAATPSGPTPVLPGKPPKAEAPKAAAITPEAKLARDTAVQNLYNAVQDAQKKGHLVSEKQSFVANRATELRQGRAYAPGGTAQKTSIDNIDAAATQLLRQFIQKGTSGTLNTKVEQENFLKSVGGGNATYETRLTTIRNFAKQNGIKINEAGTAKPKAEAPKAATPTTKAPPGVPPEDWKYMSPAERKLWLK
jgi:hypothetical protein